MKQAVIGLILVVLSAESRTQEPQNHSEGMCTLAGVVVKSTTGDPLKRAIVSLQRIGTSRDDEQYSSRTDAAGRFSFTGLKPGDYGLSVSRDGYLSLSYGSEKPDTPPKPLTLRPGERKADLLFRLSPLGNIAGHVYDEDGEPLSGATIQAQRYSYFNGRRQFVPAASTNSDDLGAYLLPGLTPSNYYVIATYDDQTPSDQSTPTTYVPVYYPGTNDPTAAQPICVATGQELSGIDFTMVPVRSVSIRGQVISTVGRVIPGLAVELLRRDSAMLSDQASVAVDPQGRFEMRGVSPGSYVLDVQYVEGAQQYSGRQVVEVGNSDIDGVELVLGPGSEVKGYLRLDGNADLGLKGLQVQLASREQIQMGALSAPVNIDGGFTFHHVPDGPYSLDLCCLPPNFYLKAARRGSEEALTNGLNLNQAQSYGSLEMTISPTGGQIEGVVLSDEKPASSGVVVLVPDANHRSQTSLYRTAKLTVDGRFTLASISPGEYSLFAWEKADNGVYLDPEFLRTYERYGKPINVEEGSRLTIQLELIRCAENTPEHSHLGADCYNCPN